jgi:hypothetical protein
MVAFRLLPRRLLAVFSWPVLLVIVWWMEGWCLALAFIPKGVNALVLIVVFHLPAFLLAGTYLYT